MCLFTRRRNYEAEVFALKRIISLFLALTLVLCACGKKTENTTTWQEQYDLGVRYLSEGNYEQAILAFEAETKRKSILNQDAFDDERAGLCS